VIQTALLLAVSVVVIWRDRELFLTPPTPRATPGGIIQARVANPDPTPSYPTGTGAGRPSLTHDRPVVSGSDTKRWHVPPHRRAGAIRSGP
jgi:hypothetical protein